MSKAAELALPQYPDTLIKTILRSVKTIAMVGASGNDIRFVATGVTDGEVLKGVHFFARGARTHSLLLDRLMGKLRFIDTTHFEDIDHPPLIRLE